MNQLTEHMLTRYAIEIGGLRDSRNKHIRPAIVWVRKFTGLVYETVAGSMGKPPVLKPVKQWTNPQSLVPVLLPLVVKVRVFLDIQKTFLKIGKNGIKKR